MVRGVVPLATSGYSVELEAEAQQWIEEVTGEPFEGEFAKELRDGRRLCLLINAIRPGSVRRVNDSKTPFKQMENISNFLKACRAVGVPEYSLFETVDLFELKDLVLVVKCLHALGGTVQLTCPDFQGPHLGLKPAQKSTTTNTDAFARKSRPTPATANVPQDRVGSSLSYPTSTLRPGGAPATGRPSTHDASLTSAATPMVQEPHAAAPLANQADLGRGPGADVDYGDTIPPPPTFDDSASQMREGGAESNLPPPPVFDERATPWGNKHEQGVDDEDDEDDGGRPSPPPYQERRFTTTRVMPPSAAPLAVPCSVPGCLLDDFPEAVNVTGNCSRLSNRVTIPTGDEGSGPYNVSNPATTAPGKVHASVLPKSSTSVSAASTKSCSPPRSGAASAASLSPQSSASATALQQQHFAVAQEASPVTKASRGGGYGLDAELAARREANYDYESEAEAQGWIEAVTGEPFADIFGEELRSGRRLCILINAIRPGVVRKVNDSKMPFKQMENISNFLKACRAVGVAEYSLFETVDLFEGKDLGLVVRCLHALGQTVQTTCPEYDGPRLGIKQTDANKRQWTLEQQEEQKRKSSGAMTQLMAGSSATMERSNIIKEGATFGASTSGTGTSSEPVRWTMGSYATMERTTITKSGPTFGADYVGTGDRNSVSKITQGFR